MKIVNLYVYKREDGGITVSSIKPIDTDYKIKYRLIADKGMELTNGDISVSCIDTYNINEWVEQSMPFSE